MLTHIIIFHKIIVDKIIYALYDFTIQCIVLFIKIYFVMNYAIFIFYPNNHFVLIGYLDELI